MDLNGWSPNGPELKVNKQTLIKIELERKHQKFNNSQSKRSYGIRVEISTYKMITYPSSSAHKETQRGSIILYFCLCSSSQLSGKHTLWFQMIKLFVSSFVRIHLRWRVRLLTVRLSIIITRFHRYCYLGCYCVFNNCMIYHCCRLRDERGDMDRIMAMDKARDGSHNGELHYFANLSIERIDREVVPRYLFQ